MANSRANFVRQVIVSSHNPMCWIRDEHWWWLVTLYQADQINQ